MNYQAILTFSIYWKAENWIRNAAFEKPKLKYWNLKAEAGKLGSKSGNVEIGI